nr:hypothetical protein [uncultured Carboxylicivirga sp.]
MKIHQIMKILQILLISITVVGCRFNYSEPAGKISDDENSSGLITAKRSLIYIQENKTDSLRGLFNSKVAKMVKPEQLHWLMQEGQKVLNEYIYPNDTSILKSQSTNYSMGGKKIVEMFSFPFQNKTYKDSLKYFHITVVDNEIHRLFLNDYPPGMRIIEPKHTEPHKDNFDMKTENLRWFRIWYEGGDKVDSKKGKNYYYAVSGDKEKLVNIGADRLIQDVFDILNTAKFDSLDVKYLGDDDNGDDEWIYLRFKFQNPEYKDLGEFTLSCFLDSEQGADKPFSKYIIFKHTDKTRYLLLRDKNPELVQILSKIGNFNYGKNYERYP